MSNEKTTHIYKIIERDLRQAILDGTLKQGDMIPSEIELCAKYGVARMTVRQAINNLLLDGYIYRHKGRGTFVIFNKKEMDKFRSSPYFSLYEEMIDINSPITNVVVDFQIIDADEIIAKRLQLTTDTKVYYVERIRKANNMALVYERLYLPKAMYPDLNIQVFEGSFHDYVQKTLNFQIRNYESALEARPLSEKVAKIFQQSSGEPSLYMSSVTYLNNGRAFVYTRQYFHGNHFRFRYHSIYQQEAK